MKALLPILSLFLCFNLVAQNTNSKAVAKTDLKTYNEIVKIEDLTISFEALDKTQIDGLKSYYIQYCIDKFTIESFESLVIDAKCDLQIKFNKKANGLLIKRWLAVNNITELQNTNSETIN